MEKWLADGYSRDEMAELAAVQWGFRDPQHQQLREIIAVAQKNLCERLGKTQNEFRSGVLYQLEKIIADDLAKTADRIQAIRTKMQLLGLNAPIVVRGDFEFLQRVREDVEELSGVPIESEEGEEAILAYDRTFFARGSGRGPGEDGDRGGDRVSGEDGAPRDPR